MPLLSNLLKLLPKGYTNPNPGWMDGPGTGGYGGNMPQDNNWNPLAGLIPGMQQPDNMQNPDQGAQSPLSALGSSQDATGSDSNQPGTYDTPLLNQYKNLLQKPPNPSDFAPSKTRKVLGLLAGLGAGAAPAGQSDGAMIGFRYNPKAQMEAQDEVVNGPYNKAMKQYNTQALLMGKGADVEEKQFTNQRMLEQSRSLDTIRQQNADTAARKEQDIYETKQRELQAKLDIAEKNLAEKQREADMKGASASAQLELKRAQMEVTDATNRLKIQQEENKLDEAKRFHEAQMKDMADKLKVAEDRAATYDKSVNNKPGAVGETDTTKKDIYEGGFDVPLLGHIGGKKVGTQTSVTKKPAGNYTPMPTPGMVKMKGPDGNVYSIPADKVEDAKKNRMVVVQ